MREKFARFMQGRYGNDELSRFMLIVALILIIINFFVKTGILNSIALVILILHFIRFFSKNYQRRSAENQKYIQIKDKLFGKFGKNKKSGNQQQYRQSYDQQQQAQYHIFKCPSCGQKIRIPKGKGKVEISCPKCRTTFIKKS